MTGYWGGEGAVTLKVAATSVSWNGDERHRKQPERHWGQSYFCANFHHWHGFYYTMVSAGIFYSKWIEISIRIEWDARVRMNVNCSFSQRSVGSLLGFWKKKKKFLAYRLVISYSFCYRFYARETATVIGVNINTRAFIILHIAYVIIYFDIDYYAYDILLQLWIALELKASMECNF